MKKFVIVGLAIMSMCFLLTGCGKQQEEPAAGVSIANAEGQTLGFTYLYDLGNGYKLYADNFTKIVYLRYDYQGGKGATSVGSASMCSYISANGNYYKVNTQTRVIEEFIPTGNIAPNPDSAVTVETGTSDSQKSDIEAILNENGQKNENSNNQQKKEAEEAQNNDGAQSTPIDPNAQQSVEGENEIEGEEGSVPEEEITQE